MPHFPKPFFRESRGLWYVQIDGKQHNLGADEAAAFDEYHRLMQQPKEQRRVAPESVAALSDQFLDWSEKHQAPDTFRWYKDRLQQFVTRYPELLVGQLKPFHVQQWIDSYKLSSGSKRNFARSIVRCMNWCEEQGLIDKSPLRHFKKPRGGGREQVISPEEYAAILKAIKRQAFRDLVTFAWETGARAAECLDIEKRHVELANHRIVFSVSEEKMDRAPRIIYLNSDAEKIVRRLIAKSPTGPIFLNNEGEPWTADAVNCAFARVKKKTKIRYCLTAFRHSWCHRMLRSGVDALTVSVLMGHADPSMIARVYSHLSHAPEYLLDSVKKGTSVPLTA
jgi:integrase